ncbi:hypothetical protein BDQ17DRAFT_1325179 [Cyathus striatus]|nr:hypothetical protein BDQ17DRAFT_1325179 [Cyathus striatus]
MAPHSKANWAHASNLAIGRDSQNMSKNQLRTSPGDVVDDTNNFIPEPSLPTSTDQVEDVFEDTIGDFEEPCSKERHVEYSDDSDTKDDITEITALEQFMHTLTLAQKAAEEAEKRKLKRPKHYLGNASCTKCRHLQRGREYADKGFPSVATFFAHVRKDLQHNSNGVIVNDTQEEAVEEEGRVFEQEEIQNVDVDAQSKSYLKKGWILT